MGSLASHFSAFLFLFPIGIRRLLCCFSLYLKNPSLYRSKSWYFSKPIWKSLDLFVLLIALPIASFSQIFFFFTISSPPIHRFAFLQQSLVILIFWVVLILILLREFLDPFFINESFIFVFAGISFLIDYSMICNEISGSGVVPSARVYELLAELTLVCAASCFYLSFNPSALFAEAALSLGIVFKGTWMLQAGLSLYSDAFSPKGCHKISIPSSSERTNSQCDLEEDGLRGVALINLLFIGHAIVVLIVCFVLFGALACNVNLRCGEQNTSPLMAEIESESLLMPELEME